MRSRCSGLRSSCMITPALSWPSRTTATLDDVAEWIREADRGQPSSFEGNYSTYLENKAARPRLRTSRTPSAQRKCVLELEWVCSFWLVPGKEPRAPDRYEQMEAEARASGLARLPRKLDSCGVHVWAKVLRLIIHKAFGEYVLIDDLSLSLPRNGISLA